MRIGVSNCFIIYLLILNGLFLFMGYNEIILCVKIDYIFKIKLLDNKFGHNKKRFNV